MLCITELYIIMLEGNAEGVHVLAHDQLQQTAVSI
jgi:hypothetical protein